MTPFVVALTGWIAFIIAHVRGCHLGWQWHDAYVELQGARRDRLRAAAAALDWIAQSAEDTSLTMEDALVEIIDVARPAARAARR